MICVELQQMEMTSWERQSQITFVVMVTTKLSVVYRYLMRNAVALIRYITAVI